MNQTLDIRELNERIQRESSFLDLISMEMNKVIVGQKHLMECFINWPVVGWSYSFGRCTGAGKNFGH